MRRALMFVLSLLVLAGSAAWLSHARDLRKLEAQLTGAAEVVTTTHGPVAFEAGGTGVPVLAIHGAGGGHDQGRLMAQAFLPADYHWIAPSRFGYPGAPRPVDASTAAQADAFAELLGSLGIHRVTVIAMSGGVPPALQFALRHPERTQALILLSLAPYAPLTATAQKLPVPLWLYDMLFKSDLPLWAVQRVAPRALAPIFDAREELTARMTEREAVFLDAMIAAFLPVTERRAGLANEGAAIDGAFAIDAAAITAPVLIVHARDDRITPFSTATFTAESIGGAETLFLDTGGHLLLGHHDAVRQRIAEFLITRVRANAK